MKCIVCATESDNMTCPGCGFIRPRSVGDPEIYQQMLYGLAEEYKKNLKINVRIVLTFYTYKMVNGGLEEDGTEELTLTENYEELEPGTIVWNDRQFARMEPGEEIRLSGWIQNDEKKREWNTSVNAPETVGLWKIGIRREPGLRFSLVLGNERADSESEAMSMRI